MAAAFKRPESVLVVVYTRTGKVLMLKRADHANFWQSVTGSLEWGEMDIAATARRELHEETGIDAPALRNWGITRQYDIFPEFRHRYAPDVAHNTEHMFSLQLAHEVPVRLNPLEHSEYRWLEFPAAETLCLSWTNREAIAMIAHAVAKG